MSNLYQSAAPLRRDRAFEELTKDSVLLERAKENLGMVNGQRRVLASALIDLNAGNDVTSTLLTVPSGKLVIVTDVIMRKFVPVEPEEVDAQIGFGVNGIADLTRGGFIVLDDIFSGNYAGFVSLARAFDSGDGVPYLLPRAQNVPIEGDTIDFILQQANASPLTCTVDVIGYVEEYKP